MSFTTVAFAENADAGGVFTTLNAVPDQHVTAVGVDIQVPAYNRIIGAMACVGNNAGARARIVSPSLRRVNPYHISPVNLGLVPADPPAIDMVSGRTVLLDLGENIEAEEDANPAALEQHAVAVWLADKDVTPVSGKIHTVRFTVLVAQAINAWTFAGIDTVDDLPAGNYAVVGARLVAAGGIVARLVPIGETSRPGFSVSQSVAHIDADLFRVGWLGEWFRFNTLQLPGLEILGSAAAAAATYDGYLDVIPL